MTCFTLEIRSTIGIARKVVAYRGQGLGKIAGFATAICLIGMVLRCHMIIKRNACASVKCAFEPGVDLSLFKIRSTFSQEAPKSVPKIRKVRPRSIGNKF